MPGQWNLLIRDTLVHRPLSLIRRLSLIGRFGIKLSFYELLQHFMNFYSISDIQNTLWCNKMVQSTLFQTRNIVRSNVI